MKGKWPYRNYIDLMAGPGKDRIRGTNTIFLGSPLIALATRHPFTGYFFVELGQENINALTQRCVASTYSSRVSIYAGDCNIEVNQIVTQLKKTEKNALNLAFLDPEGLELEWKTVAHLASVQRMDLIINYPQGGLNRLMPVAIANNAWSPIDAFFGGQEWREIYNQYRGKQGLHRQLMDLYKSNLHLLGYKEVIRDDETGDEPLIRNAKEAPLYRLLFASKHPLGHDFWQKITRRDVHGQPRLF